jgi:hypothetical protein
MKTISIKSYRTLLATRDDREHTHLALRHALRRALIVRSAGKVRGIAMARLLVALRPLA